MEVVGPSPFQGEGWVGVAASSIDSPAPRPSQTPSRRSPGSTLEHSDGAPSGRGRAIPLYDGLAFPTQEFAMPEPSAELTRILESARRLGVELDEADALQWLSAIAAAQTGGEIVVDTRTGVFGHKVSMLDFSPQDLEHFRRIGTLVEFLDRPGVVETALALSGSAAQSKIQSYPGDCDYFERVHIKGAA